MLLFYNFDFDLLHVETKIISSSWSFYFNGVGTFEAHIPISSEMLKIVTENKYLVAKEGGQAAIIIGFEIGDELVLYGRTPNWILSKRVTPSIKTTSDKAGILCKDLIESTFFDVSNFVVEPLPNTSKVTIERSSKTTVLNAVSDCLALVNLGHKVSFDVKERKWRFSVLCENENPILISDANKNAYKTSLYNDILDVADCGYFGSDGEISGKNTGIYRWEAILDGETEAEAINSLSKKNMNNRISLTVKNLRFGTDYNLGDIVRIQIIKGNFKTTLKKRISGINIKKHNGYYEEEPIFEDIGGTN